MYNSSRDRIESLGFEARDYDKDRMVVDCLGGYFSLVVKKADPAVGMSIATHGYWEAWVTSWFTRWVRPGMTVLDVGANCGYYTMLSERLVGRYGHVVAYEPHPDYLDDLNITRKLNGAKFKHRPVGLGAEPRDATLTVDPSNLGGGTLRADYDHKYPVRITTLDSEERNLTFFNPNIIKLDIESFEEEAWLGGQVLLNAPHQHTTLILEWTPGSYSEEFAGRLHEWGDTYLVGFDGAEYSISPEGMNSIDDLQMIVVRKR